MLIDKLKWVNPNMLNGSEFLLLGLTSIVETKRTVYFHMFEGRETLNESFILKSEVKLSLLISSFICLDMAKGPNLYL